MLNKIYLLIFLLFFLSSCWGDKPEPEPEIIGVHVSDKSFAEKNPTIDEKEKQRIEEEQTEINTLKTNKIKSYIRTFCKSYKDINLFVDSRHFKILKERVDFVESDKGNFLFIELPTYVYNNCIEKESEYLETLILYLQTDSNELAGLKSKIDNKGLENYINDLTLTEEGEEFNNLKEGVEFNTFFLDKKKVELEAFYYPYYIKEKENVSSFLNKPIFSLGKDNSNKDLALKKLIKELEKLGFESLDEFKSLILKNNNFNSVQELKDSMINDYKKILILEENIAGVLSDLGKFKSYLISNKHKKLLENEDNYKLINEIGRKMLILSIVSDDYADGLNETWAGKQFFGDETIGNGIIRLNFIYILTL